MKFFTVNLIILIIIVTTSVESARIRRNEGNKKKSNLAVMLAYKPNSEIRTKDEHDNTWTYQIKSDDRTGSEELNKKLLEILVRQKFGNYGEKAINKKRHAETSSCESNENIDDAKVVEVRKQDKQACYKNTYKNVLSAFEEALKSQIQSYKKCVCQKKQQTSTTTTTTTTTTLAPVQARSADESEEESHESNLDNEEELATAIENSDDVICFHKQYAFMLQKLLDTIPCKKQSGNEIKPQDLLEFEGKISTRKERQNARDIKSSSDLGEVKNDDELKDQVINILKDYLNEKKRENVKPTTTTTQPPPTPESVESEENLNEEKFFEKLRKLFKQLESDDETFPVPKDGSSQSESTTSVPSTKFPKKSKSSVTADIKARKSRRTELGSAEIRRKSSKAVTEHSDESTETTIKLKKGKFEKKRLASEELSRGDSTKGSKLSKNSVHTKSYRTTSRSPITTTTSTTSRAISADHSSEEEEEEIKEVSDEKRGRNADDDRLAGDLAKAISDLAKKYLNN